MCSFETLPIELQEIVCKYLDGDTLLKACCVSTQWNKIISSLHTVWHCMCRRLNCHVLPCETDDWKKHYLAHRRQLYHLKQGRAFQHFNHVPETFRGSAIRGLAYSNGYLIAGIHNQVQIWKIADLQSVGLFSVPYKLSCLAVSEDGEVLGMGRHNGYINTWKLRTEKQVCNEQLLEYHGHTNTVTSLAISCKLGLLCSGSTDRTARVWNLYAGTLLWTVTRTRPLSQVAMLPSSVPTLTYTLLVADDVNIEKFSWLTQANRMEQSEPSFPSGALKHRFFVHNKKLVYVKEGGTIMITDWSSGRVLKELALQCADIDLVAVGSQFLLAIQWDNIYMKQELLVIDMSNDDIVATYPMPLCRPDHIVTGDAAWLSELTTWKPGALVVAACNTIQSTACFYMVTWRYHGDKTKCSTENNV
ncbi:F-box/WD repeat-containing protein 2-like [Periplaneta americana]|uniref:F-box/WD repeat-containing protein 2-like n=1 Tax=Periplaneta americana TaxID=6978 RepID=UPI0037E9893B